MTAMLWVLAVAPALVAAGALVVPGRHRAALVQLSPLAVLAALPLVLVGPDALDVPWLLLGTTLALDAVGRPLLLVAVLLYAAALASTPATVPHRRPAFTAFLLVCWLGNAGVLVAADAVTFYLSFAVLSFTAYGLVVHDRTPSAARAGRVYLVMVVVGELFLLTGLLMAVHEGGRDLAALPAAVAGSSYRDLVVALLLVGFGVKAGLVPLHVWLPLAHPAAPVPASAVLSGAMVKAGVVGMLRFLPLGEAALPTPAAVVLLLALVGAFLAVVLGLAQSDPKAVLAYSTVSQMGFLLVLVGVALGEPSLAETALAAAVLYAVHHGFAKGALFLGVGVWKAYGGSSVRPLVLAGLGAAALAVAGAPLTSGAAAKYAAKQAIGHVPVAGVDAHLLLSLVAVGTTVLLWRFLVLLPRDVPATRGHAGAPGLLASWLLLGTAGAVLTWLLPPRWLPEAALPAPEPSALWAAAWPVLLGAGLLLAHRVLLVHRRARGHPQAGLPRVPPGDLVALAGPAARAAGEMTAAVRARLRPLFAVRPLLPPAPGAVSRAEGTLSGWRASGVAVVVVLLAVAAALGVR